MSREIKWLRNCLILTISGSALSGYIFYKILKNIIKNDEELK